MTQTALMPHRADLQGLRAIAVAIVVVAHSGATWLPGGFIGVDLFFVLSGYLISGLLIREFEDSGTIRLASFFARRLKRLLPALLVMLMLVVLTATLMLSNFEAVAQTGSAAFAATWSSNFFFAFNALDYFDELQARDFFLHTWSLGVEEQFYLFWPLLLMVMLTLTKRLRSVELRQRASLCLLALLGVLSFGLALYWSKTHPLWSFYLMPSRIWQFSLGSAVFVLCGSRSFERSATGQILESYRGHLGCFGLLMIAGSAALMHRDLIYPGFWALLPSIGAALLIAAGIARTPGVPTRALQHPIMVWLGDRSYSWYLWHWSVLVLGRTLGISMQPFGTAALVMFSLLLAGLSYRWVEQPFWKGRLSHAGPSRTIVLSILAMTLLVFVTTRYLDYFRPDASGLPGTMTRARSARIDLPVIYAQSCDTWYRDARLTPCITGPVDAPRTAVLIGDSIGAQWYSLLPALFPAPEWRVIVLTKSACAMVDEDYVYARIGRVYSVCTQWRADALRYLESMHPDVVFVGSSAIYEFSEAQWIEGSTRVIARLAAVAEHVLIIPGTPMLPFDGPGCLDRELGESIRPAHADPSICTAPPADARYVDVARYLGGVAGKFENVHLLDFNEQVCPNAICAAQDVDGMFVFRDTQHLTDSFVRRQMPAAIDRLSALGLVPPTRSTPDAANAAARLH